MSKAATITIINQGPGVGPFNIYGLDINEDVIETIQLNVPLATLTAGYNVYNLSDSTEFIKIVSNNVLCNGVLTVPLQTPPPCNCITIENPVDQIAYYSYTDCNGDEVNNVQINQFSAAQVCGSDATSGSSDVIITEGSACDEEECINGTLVLQNSTIDGTVNITNVTPTRFYSFSTPPEFPDSPTVVFPVISGDLVTGARIKYNSPITVTVNSNADLNIILQLFRNSILMETKNEAFVSGNNTVVFNSVGAYAFNTTDELKIVMIDGVN
jgi:hypothetical protein